jgi:hypothetical protein
MVDIPDDIPSELWAEIGEFFPESEQLNAANIAYLESGWNAFALNDSATEAGGCGVPLGERNGIQITSERSIGYFQINSCNFPDWEWQRLYNARHNVGTAHLLWDRAGRKWSGPWYFSAAALGLA